MSGTKATSTYYGSGKLRSMTWSREDDGAIHRDCGPARLDYYSTGILFRKTWYQNGKMNRDGAPALVTFYTTGELCSLEFYKDSATHRDMGPAIIQFATSGALYKCWYFKNGVNVTTALFECGAIDSNSIITDLDLFEYCWGLM